METLVGLFLALLGIIGVILLFVGPPALFVLVIVLIVRALGRK